jgi:hypothetical protein
MAGAELAPAVARAAEDGGFPVPPVLAGEDEAGEPAAAWGPSALPAARPASTRTASPAPAALAVLVG